MADNLKLAAGLRNLPASARQDLAQREEDMQRGKTVELLRRAGKEMYENPIVNTAIGLSPVLGDIQAGVEAYRSAQAGDWGNAGLNAAGMLPFIPMLGKTVWHGSPHSFEKFDLSKIGTGEGAQAYGHGLYLAESPEVAGSYKSAGDMGWFEREADKTLFNKDIDQAIESTRTELERVRQIPKATAATENLQGVLNVLEARKSGAGEYGNLYKVDLPDEQIAKMLDWDKPLNEQPEHIQKAWGKFVNSKAGQAADKSLGGWLSQGKGQFENPTGKHMYDTMSEGYIGVGKPRPFLQVRQEVSDLLNKQGIPGIQYLDQASRDVGDGTRNYVVFSDEIPQILERNNQVIK